MGIRYLALSLYKAMQRVEELREELEKAAPEERSRIEARLWQACRERDEIKRILDGKKR